MMIVIILITVIAGSLSQPIVKTWTLNELSTAIEKQSNEAMQPYFVDALNRIMYGLFTENDQDVHALILSPTGGMNWTIEQLKKAIDDPETKDTLKPFFERAVQQLANMEADGRSQDSVEVSVPALDISVWTINDVQEAKDDPSTKPALLPYLKTAEDKIMDALAKGQKKEDVSITLVTPVGLVPIKKGIFPEIVPRSVLL